MRVRRLQDEEKAEKVTALEQIITELQAQLSDAQTTDGIALAAAPAAHDVVSGLKKELEEARGAFIRCHLFPSRRAFCVLSLCGSDSRLLTGLRFVSR